ncbi:MAG: agmatinase [Deltaproteobacteria bacterium]
MEKTLYLEAFSDEILPESPAILGVPLDITATYRCGSADGPDAIRMASDSIESYSPLLDRDLVDSPYADLGDMHFSDKRLESCLDGIMRRVFRMEQKGCPPLCLGGEHTITLPIVRAVVIFHPDLVVVDLDAHADCRDHYEGSFVNHATVMRRVAEVVGPSRLIQIGVRSGTREEFGWMRQRETRLEWTPQATEKLLQRIENRPVYLTLDLDVLDPACLPGTGNPEPGGWFYHDLELLLRDLSRVNLVAADVVELNPRLDPSGVSSVTAAKVVRELLLILGNRVPQTDPGF